MGGLETQILNTSQADQSRIILLNVDQVDRILVTSQTCLERKLYRFFSLHQNKCIS